jgi:hypothetical protein
LAGVDCRGQLKGASATPHAGRSCWRKKTLSDAQRNLVNLRPRDTTVAAMNAVTPPRVLKRTRAPFERQVWRVAAQITESKLEADADIHLVLFDSGAYITAEMPAATCLPARTRDRRAIINARRLFVTRCGFASTT